MNLDFFPYIPRKNQKTLIKFVQQNISSKKAILIDAPNGFGKTPCLLAALIPFILNQDKRIIWAVRTGTETDRPIEELKKIVKKKRVDIWGMSYRGKRDMCLLLKEKRIKKATHADANFLCSRLRDKCKYYNFEFSQLQPLLKEPRIYSEIYNFCEKNKICPYFVQRELLPFAQVLGLSYNYIFSESLAWIIKIKFPFYNSILVVDEAHNIEKACQSLNSDTITLKSIKRALEELKEYKLNSKVKEWIISLEREFENYLIKLKENNKDECIFDVENFLKKFKELPKALEDLKKYGIKVRERRLEKGKRPTSSLFHLANFWLKSLEMKDIEGVVFLATKVGKDNLQVERWDMRSKVLLEERWKEFSNCIFCSGTLKPFDSFAEIAGIDDFIAKSFPQPYPQENFSFLIIKGVTTKGEVLSEEMAKRYLELIKIFVENLNTNLAIFSASYRIQEDLIKAGLKEIIENAGKKIFIEYEGMSGTLSRKILEEFKKCSKEKKKGVLVASATGRFAEGADFPGKELEGIFLVGIPFDKLTLRTKLYLKYYRKLYGRKGRRYGYVIPALRRASQTLGRALRNPDDKALLIAGDERYAKNTYLKLLPNWLTQWVRAVNMDEFKKLLKTKI